MITSGIDILHYYIKKNNNETSLMPTEIEEGDQGTADPGKAGLEGGSLQAVMADILADGGAVFFCSTRTRGPQAVVIFLVVP
jgi:hypothetical protein